MLEKMRKWWRRKKKRKIQRLHNKDDWVCTVHTHTFYIYICSNLYLLVLLSWFLLLSLYFISIIIHSVKTKNI